mmetsp:Transcript_20013/g.29664  ORF Transcript_20013/g.29664 Transcript_20013/m.29664 type:complete len:219 (-) Transcript_20013:25-681(-)
MTSLQAIIRNKEYLPADYSPRQFDVVCENTLRARLHNKRFHATIRLHLKLYLGASDKNNLIDKLIDSIRQQSIGGGFIKKDCALGLYFEVGDFQARQKIIQAFKEAEISTSHRRVGKEITQEKCSIQSQLPRLGRFEGIFEGIDFFDQKEKISESLQAPSWVQTSCSINHKCSAHFHPSDFQMKRCNRDLMDDDEELSLVESFFDISRRKSSLAVVEQ